MTVFDIIIRLLLSVLISGIIGLDREKSGSNAGLRTHTLVGVGSTTISLIQVALIYLTLEINATGIIRTDPSRLVAQIISGIGFLGAGTIIVTKRNVSGLTTAASIWNVAAIGIAIGLGFYSIAIFSFLFTTITLKVLKSLSKSIRKERILIKYVEGENTLDEIEKVFDNLGYETFNLKYTTSILGMEFVYAQLFEIENSGDFIFSDLVSHLSHIENVVSVERTNIEQ